MSTKSVSLIDLNLISGSKELFRMAIGGYYDIVSSSYGEVLDSIAYENGSAFTEEFLLDAEKGIGIEADLEETIDDKIIIPNKQVPIRLYGNSDVIKNDTHWKTVLLGGTYGNNSYDGIYEEKIYDNHTFDYSLPYSKMESITIPGGDYFETPIQITYDYNIYLKEYQDYISNIDTELIIPNMYLFKSIQLALEDDGEINELTSSMTDFVSLEGMVSEDDMFLFLMEVEDDAEISETAREQIENSLVVYLSSSIIMNPLSSSTVTNMKNSFQNIMFDEDVLSDDGSPYTLMTDSTGKIPYYMTFDIPVTAGSTFVESIKDNDFSQKFLKTLKEVFLEETTIVPSNTSYVFDASYYSGSEEDDELHIIESANNESVRVVDYLKLLTYAHNNYVSTTNNCCFIGGISDARSAVFDKNGAYRYRNSISSMRVLNDTVDYLNTNFDLSDVITRTVTTDRSSRKTTVTTEVSTFLETIYTTESRNNETLAYRVEKIGGLPSGDSKTQNVLQNYWFFNSDSLEEINFFDSQIKYGEDYTYKVYAYVLVDGVKYNFSDIRPTRLISSSSAESRCLEFYDIDTEAPIVQLFTSAEDNALLANNRYASNAQITTDQRYIADFYLNCEPNLKIIEIPVFSKTLRVMDNPPNTFDVTPNHKPDASNTIEFFINYETFYPKLTHPKILSEDDKLTIEAYLHGKDFSKSSELDLESVSRQRYIEMYRIDKMPTAFTDFDGSLIKTIDLIMPESKYTYPNAQLSDRIRTNKKYYYIFRFLNEQRVPGPISEIYEAQLVNDGGYVYSIFNILYEEDIIKDNFLNPFKQFKKLIQLQPNVSHLILNTGDLDFDDIASSQIGNLLVGTAEDAIWDKPFKIRATSKKTGKKIDFNITYKIQSE